METILLALAPIVVTLITQGVKKLRTIQLSSQKNTIVRVLVVILSFAATVGHSWLSNTPIDPTSVQTFVQTVLVAAAAFLPYHFGKK